MPLRFSGITYLFFGLNAREIKRNQTTVIATVEILNREQRALDYRSSLFRLHGFCRDFAGQKHQKIINIEVMMLMNVIGESVKFFGKEVYLGKLYKSSRSYENRVNKHVVISLNFPCLIASLPSCLLMSFFLFVLWLGFV